jgi:acyl-CoA thioesterase YciA
MGQRLPAEAPTSTRVFRVVSSSSARGDERREAFFGDKKIAKRRRASVDCLGASQWSKMPILGRLPRNCFSHAPAESGRRKFQSMSDPYLAIQVVMMPRDTNPAGTIFGGVILSYIDQAGAIGARREVVRAGGSLPMLLTVAVNRVEFHQPVHVGDVVRFMARLVRIGRTSITMHVNVEAERGLEVLQVTEAEVVYVGVGAHAGGRGPIPLLPQA